jgi:predicted tellurium resistance membrane protein TerC
MDFLTPDILVSLFTLSALEIVLGIDNLIFLSILAGRLPEAQRDKARRIGLAGAFVSRLGLLSAIAWIVRLDQPLFSLLGRDFSGKSLILLAGGLFLLYKATSEIHHKLEGEGAMPAGGSGSNGGRGATMGSVVFQIMLLDIVFSVDSVITAVGLTKHVWVMVTANVIALIVMVLSVHRIGAFIERHPSVKILALSFLLMVGLVLVAEGMAFHIPHGYVYFAMAFSVFVEMLNIRVSRKARPVALHTPRVEDMKD